MARGNGFHLLDEGLALLVDDRELRMIFSYVVDNRIKKVRLTQTAVAVNKEGVIILCRLFRHSLCRRISKLTAAACNEGVEGKSLDNGGGTEAFRGVLFKLYGEDVAAVYDKTEIGKIPRLCRISYP